MNVPAKPNSLQTYHMVFYNRALHPEVFSLRGRRVLQHGGYEAEGWLMAGSHSVRFEYKTVCASELVTDMDRNLPMQGVINAFVCAGEHEYEHRFTKAGVTYMATVQTESLSENVYASTFEEMLEFATVNDALKHEWEDEFGRSLSVLDMQRHANEVHAQAYHLLASSGLVLRTQTIFEVR